MRLQKIYSQGLVLNNKFYEQLKQLDYAVFFGCNNEFKENRDWWVIVDSGKIIAYCGSLYSEGVCIFVRAWVSLKYRNKGLQSKMIKTRLKAAKQFCYVAITYTTHTNVHSANNLFKNGFKMYIPQQQYSGKEMIYFKTDL